MGSPLLAPTHQETIFMHKAQSGHFYAIGIGPGAPDLLTVRAVRIIESADIILCPQANGSNRSLALAAIEPYRHAQEVMTVNYPMQRNGDQTQERWNAVAEEVLEKLRRGQSVAMITIGDPLIFATTSYLLTPLSAALDAEKLHLIPGISAFQIAASRFSEPLVQQEGRLILMSATDLEAVANALDHCETLVLYKAAGVIDRLRELLDKRELLATSKLVSCAEQGADELICADLQHWQPHPLPYMTTVIIRVASKNWQPENR